VAWVENLHDKNRVVYRKDLICRRQDFYKAPL